MEGGDIVAVVNGKVTKPENLARLGNKTAALYMIVTDSAGVIGNSGCPPEVCVAVSFTGQVRTKVNGVVKDGDYVLVDGTSAGRVKAKDDVTFEEYKTKVVGIALEGKSSEDVARIVVAVGVK